MTVSEYNIIYGVPLLREELTILLSFFASRQDSRVYRVLNGLGHNPQQLLSRVITDTFEPFGPHDDDTSYADMFTNFTDALEHDLKAFGCDVIVTHQQVETPELASRGLYGYSMPIVVIGNLIRNFTPDLNDNPELLRIEPVLPWAVSQLTEAVFPRGQALQVAARYGLFLNTEHN